jgi:hypothetical protein
MSMSALDMASSPTRPGFSQLSASTGESEAIANAIATAVAQ